MGREIGKARVFTHTLQFMLNFFYPLFGHTNEINKSLYENCLQGNPAKRNAVHQARHKPWLIFFIMTDCFTGPPTTF